MGAPEGFWTMKELSLPGKPVACNFGLLWLIYGLLWGIVACCFGLLGFPGKSHRVPYCNLKYIP